VMSKTKKIVVKGKNKLNPSARPCLPFYAS
jgi:hypothetical protein